ncbi:hypothetical protein DV515_00019151 [Chloebia gouldiae]|uniref:Uncharacterized protein n=1 Tax=Chloebia gouldiae TaxID=44316 RepID=A0A3L8Q5I7_CHLGU|nr:hypothetical protein DV515_00019151 [Chloebia gouldiae]
MRCFAILEQSHYSKAKRKKKEESDTLPQVSEEIDYYITADLKDLFGASQNKPEKTAEIPWDKEDAQDFAPDDHLGPLPENDAAQDSTAFKFSFFGDTEELGIKEEYSRDPKKSGKSYGRDVAQKIWQKQILSFLHLSSPIVFRIWNKKASKSHMVRGFTFPRQQF